MTSDNPSVCPSLQPLGWPSVGESLGDTDGSLAGLQADDTNQYHFRFTLPASLPSSFDGKWGQIHYGVKVKFARHRKNRIEQETPFSVIGAVDVHREPELQVGGATVNHDR